MTDPRVPVLHRAVRAAIVVPSLFAFSLLVIRDLNVATFTVFGSVALLVLADFGGRRRPRAAAYAAATLAGAALVTLGTVVSPNAVVAAAVMLAVGFTLSFAGVFGGYIPAAQTALLLSFVLAASIPATLSAVPARVGGWILAGAVATIAGVFFWPWFEQVMLHKRAAEACVAVADLVAAERENEQVGRSATLMQAARNALSALRGEYARTSLRPAGPTRRHRAFVLLMTQLEQVVDLSERPFHEQRHRSLRPCTEEGRRLAAGVTAALRASAAMLSGGGPPPDIRAVDDARGAHRAALDDWVAGELRRGRTPEEVLAGIDVDHTLRVVAYLTIVLSANAVIAAGGRLDDSFPFPAAIPRREGLGGIVRRTVTTIRTHLEPSSTVLHSSLRVAIGLAVSVLLARTLGLGHAFWVVLGTLSVLRSNALSTGRTTVQALAGTVIGIVIGGVVVSVAGQQSVLMWIAMPLALFFASYAAGAIGFVAGQAAFTLTVIVIFNLIAPAGWQVGLVRIEDVAVGTGVSLVVGLLLWPRGARRDVARTTAMFYGAVAAYLERGFHLVLGMEGAADVRQLRDEAVRAGDRAGQAFDVFLNERGAKPLAPEEAARLISAGNQALLAGDLLVVVGADTAYRAYECPDGAATVEAEVQTLLAGIGRFAADLATGARDGAPPRRASAEAVRDAAVGCMRRTGGSDQATRSAMAVVIAGEWVQTLARTEADLEEPVRQALEAVRTPWWR
ncbi:MAG TPA: FUSC family protein [Candidatus Dormibacteraeota bacterium]|nr:FUSC family protein [Candidatus Dormibacteraeota bacterium]